MTPDPKALKREVRARSLAASAALSPAERQACSAAIAGRLAALAGFRAATTVALYAPLPSEVDTGPIASAVLARGGRLAYPRTRPGSRRLAFCACRPGELVRGPLGAGEPPPDAPELPLDQLTCLLVPGVAFSRSGLRLGRGGGHYDTTLALAPGAFRVGLSFDLQLRPDLPAEPHDLPLDAIVTERETLTFQRAVTT